MRPNEQSVLWESDYYLASPEDLVLPLTFVCMLALLDLPLGFLVALKFEVKIPCWKLLV